jgi:hypothetical protein
MFLFLILVLPAALVYYLSKEDDRAEISVVLTGFFLPHCSARLRRFSVSCTAFLLPDSGSIFCI